MHTDFMSLLLLAPLPTLILGPHSTEHAQFFAELSADGGELCNNITHLGKASHACNRTFIM